ncbi:MAG: hypothetical protein ACP5FK_03470 [bacterium]
MEKFTSKISIKYLIYTFLNILMISAVAFFGLVLFVNIQNHFWEMLFLSIGLGIIFGFRRKYQVVKFYDKFLAARGNLITGYEFCYQNLPGSAELKQEAVKRINSYLKYSKVEKFLVKKIAFIVLLILVILMIPRFHPYSYTNAYNIQVIPCGDTAVTYGDQVVFKLITDEPDPSWYMVMGMDTIKFDHLQNDTFSLTTPFLFSPVDYCIGGTDTAISGGRIQLESEPLEIQDLEVMVPDYLGGYRIFTEYQKQIEVPEYSTVSFKLNSSTPIRQWIKQPEQFRDGSDSYQLMMAGEIEDTVNIFVEAVTVLGETLTFSLDVLGLEDQPPLCTRLQPEQDLYRIGQFEYIDIVVRTQDDYGLSGAELSVIDVNQANDFQEIRLEGTGPVEVNFRLVPDQLSLGPGETASVFVKVWDNSITGNISFCSPLRIVFPTLTEIYQAADSASHHYQSSAINLQERGTELLDDLSRIQQQMKQSANLSSMDRQQLQQLLQEEQQMIENLSTASEDLQNILENLLNQSVEDSLLLAKSQEISELLDQIMDEETKQMLEQIMELARTADREEVLQALEQLKQNNQQLLERLDRTLEILKNLETARKLEELIKRSLELTSRINNLDSTQFQSSLTDDIDSELDDILRELNQLMESNLNEQVNSELKQAQQSGMQAQSSLDQMQQSSSDQSSANQQAVQQMSEMTSHLENASSMFSQNRNSALSSLISETKEDVLDLSELAENIYKQNSPLFLSAAAFKATEQVMDKLDSIAHMTMIMDVRMISMLQQANQMITQANQCSQYESIFKIYNDVYVQLSNLENLMQNQMPLNSQGAQQSMSEMAGQQAQLNNQSMQTMFQGMSPSQMMSMAVQQRALSERMSEIAQGFEGSAQMIDEMEQLVREMEMAAQSLEQGDVSRSLIERQREILQKLLDLQTAMREQQSRPQRVAQTAHHYPPYPFVRGIDNIFDPHYTQNQNELPFNLNSIKSPYWNFLVDRFNHADK